MTGQIARPGAIAAVMLLLAAPAAAQAADASGIIARAGNAHGVFEPLPDGSLRHVQSGMICPASFPNVELWQIGVFPSVGFGDDVGCDYGRRGADGAPESKLAIYATRVAPGDTLEAMFEQRKLEVQYSMPEAVLAGTAIPPELAQVSGDGSGGMLSAQYALAAPDGGRGRLTDLIVAVKSGWQIKIRATYPAPEGANIDTPGPVNAWLRAMDTVGTSGR